MKTKSQTIINNVNAVLQILKILVSLYFNT